MNYVTLHCSKNGKKTGLLKQFSSLLCRPNFTFKNEHRFFGLIIIRDKKNNKIKAQLPKIAPFL